MCCQVRQCLLGTEAKNLHRISMHAKYGYFIVCVCNHQWLSPVMLKSFSLRLVHADVTW